MQQKLENIKFVITDVDGVLTDGQLHYDANGGKTSKSFHVHAFSLDIKMLMDAGIQSSAVLSGHGLPYFTSSHCRSWY